VSLVSPDRGSSVVSSPVQLKARVSSDSSSVKNADVNFYVDGGLVDSEYTDRRGIAYVYYYPSSEGTYTWYAKAYKNRYNDDVSSSRSIIYIEPSPRPDLDEGFIETYLVIEIYYYDDIQSLDTRQYGAYTFIIQNRRYAYNSIMLCQGVIDEIWNE